MQFHRTVVGVVALLLTSTALRAQVPVGTRVRIVAAPRFDRSGSIASITSDTIVLTADGESFPISIPVRSVSTLFESDGRHRHTGRGALIGFSVGAFLGALAGFNADVTTCTTDPN